MLWSQARFDLWLSDAEFLELTPRQFYVLMDRHHERTEHQELLTGIVAAAVTNSGMYRPKPLARPVTFMPSQCKADAARRKRVDRKKVAEDVRAFFSRAIEIQNKNAG